MKKQLMRLIVISGGLIMSSCAATNQISKNVQAMPVPPNYETYTRAPIIQKIDDNFLVSDEFVKKSAQEHRYLEKVKRWKIINQIP